MPFYAGPLHACERGTRHPLQDHSAVWRIACAPANPKHSSDFTKHAASWWRLGLTCCLLAFMPAGWRAKRYSKPSCRRTGLSLLRVAFSTLAIRSHNDALQPSSPDQSQSSRRDLWFTSNVDCGHSRWMGHQTWGKLTSWCGMPARSASDLEPYELSSLGQATSLMGF